MLCPGHVWVTVDKTPRGISELEATRNRDWYLCQICEHCGAPQCDSEDGWGARCQEPRHHAMLPHRTENIRWPIGMDPTAWAEAERGRWHL